jgi:serine protease Do
MGVRSLIPQSFLRPVSAALALSLFVTPLAPVMAQARGAPESFADLAESVSSAVVNISVSTTVEEKRPTIPNLPQGTPFDDLFEEFFRRRQGQGGNEGQQGQAPRQRRSSSLGSGFVIDPAGIVITNNHLI